MVSLRPGLATAPRRHFVETPTRRHGATAMCAGCGVRLQSESPASIGFVPPPSITRGADGPTSGSAATEAPLPPDGVICQRCYRAKHYGNLVPVTVPYGEFRDNLLGIMARLDCIVVVVLDVGGWPFQLLEAALLA